MNGQQYDIATGQAPSQAQSMMKCSETPESRRRAVESLGLVDDSQKFPTEKPMDSHPCPTETALADATHAALGPAPESGGSHLDPDGDLSSTQPYVGTHGRS